MPGSDPVRTRALLRALPLLPLLLLGLAGCPEKERVSEGPMVDKWTTSWARIDNPERDRHPHTRWILEAVEARPGMSIADVGAGAGYFAFKLARAVGSEGSVLATDTDGEMVAFIERNARERGVENLRAKRVNHADPGLEARAFDRILLANIGFGRKQEQDRIVMKRFAAALRPGGRLVIMMGGVNPTLKDATGEQIIAMGREAGLAPVSHREVENPGGAAYGHGPGYLVTLGVAAELDEAPPAP